MKLKLQNKGEKESQEELNALPVDKKGKKPSEKRKRKERKERDEYTGSKYTALWILLLLVLLSASVALLTRGDGLETIFSSFQGWTEVWGFGEKTYRF